MSNFHPTDVPSYEDAKCVVTIGAGKHYCLGLDLEYLAGCSPMESFAFAETLQKLMLRILTFPLVTVAAVNGESITVTHPRAHTHTHTHTHARTHTHTHTHTRRTCVCWGSVFSHCSRSHDHALRERMVSPIRGAHQTKLLSWFSGDCQVSTCS